MKVDQPISVEDFRYAVACLNFGDELRLREDGKGFATTTGERFLVAFCDLFRWGDSISLKKQEVIRTYLDAVKREYGDVIDCCTLESGFQYQGIERDAESRIQLALNRENMFSLAESLKGHLELIGIPTRQRNEIAISHAAHSLFSPMMNFCAVLPDLVNPVVAHLLERARELSLDQEVIAALASKSIGKKPPKITTLEIPVVSDAIENDLRQAAISTSSPRTRCFRELDMNEVTRVGQAAVERVVVRQINELTYSVLNRQKSTAAIFDELAEGATPEGSADRANALSLCETTIKNALSQYTYLISEDAVAAVRDAVLTSVVNGTALKLPELWEKGRFALGRSDVDSLEDSDDELSEDSDDEEKVQWQQGINPDRAESAAKT